MQVRQSPGLGNSAWLRLEAPKQEPAGAASRPGAQIDSLPESCEGVGCWELQRSEGVESACGTPNFETPSKRNNKRLSVRNLSKQTPDAKVPYQTIGREAWFPQSCLRRLFQVM